MLPIDSNVEQPAEINLCDLPSIAMCKKGIQIADPSILYTAGTYTGIP